MNPGTFICGFSVGTGVTALIASHPDWWVWFIVAVFCLVWDVYYGLSVERKYTVLLATSKMVYKSMLEARRPIREYPEIVMNFQFLRLALMRIQEVPEIPEKTKPQ